MKARLVDMHHHLDFYDKPAAFAQKAADLGISMLAVSCEPTSYLALKASALPNNVRLAAGLHPWWLSDGRVNEQELGTLLKLVKDTPYVGEVGLDFSLKHVHEDSKPLQIEAFTRIARTCAEEGEKLLSIHAVSSAATVLDILEDAKVFRSCTAIFHWFSGSTDELWRAIHAGAYFSINAMQLKTRRAREYVKLIPSECLLLESDWPPEHPGPEFHAHTLKQTLESTVETLTAWLGRDIAQETASNALGLLQGP